MNIRSAAILLTFSLAVVGCHWEPRHPPSVPAEAFWLGAKKPGVFVSIGPKTALGWVLTIYDDHSGAVKAKGPFLLLGAGRAELTKEDLAYWDGSALILADGGRMVPKP